MTRTTEIEIEGFKGIQSLHVEPTAINVITGRNNTGKTSLLEAIELVFDPNAIIQFESNLDTLVNVESETTSISMETKGDARSIGIVEPAEQRTRELLVQALLETITKVIDWARKRGIMNEEEVESINDDIHTIVEDTITPEIVEEISTEAVILSINGTEYPYLSSRGTAQQMYREIIENIQKRISDQPDEEEIGGQMSLSGFSNHIPLQTIGGPDFGFIGDGSPDSNAVTKIDGRDLTQPPEADNSESVAVKIDDIEDTLIEHEIVEDLRSFDRDYLVFTDDDGEKYSVPYEFMGDGFKAIVGILWELLDKERSSDVILLEEPAIHMHPGYVRELVYFLVDIARERNMQLFITTHNNDFVADFFGENFTDDEQSFLENEFTLVQMQSDAADVMSYRDAEEHLKDLHLDLRGI